jgi:predicted RNA binding protein with dsRBD fold (UPF0201 family)
LPSEDSKTGGSITKLVVRDKLRKDVMKDQLITVLEAMRLAQDMLEVEGHTQETLAELRSVLCSEDVIDAARALAFVDSPATAPHDGVPFPRDRRERLRAA